MSEEETKTTVTEEYFPSINIKRQIYKSKFISIITDKPLEDKNRWGFLENDLPDYAR